MKNWKSYLIFLLTGALIYAVVAAKWLTNGAVEINIEKIKNKRTSGSNEVSIPIHVESEPDRGKTSKKRGFGQFIKRRKAKKAERLLNKFN